MSGLQEPWMRCTHQETGACSECFRVVIGAVERLTRERDEAYDREVERLTRILAVYRSGSTGDMEREVERLRGLIAEAEWVQALGPVCPWCRYPQVTEHSPDCPAFSARGEVRR